MQVKLRSGTSLHLERLSCGVSDAVRGLAISGAPFFLHESTNEGFASPNALGQTTVRIEVFADDPDRLNARAVAAGVVGAPDGVQSHHAPWGVHRQGGFTDPFGHVWLVGNRSPLVSDPTAP
jgi:PhnB protein